MPKITINEQDLTTPTGIINTTDIPFVIGFTGVIAIDKLPELESDIKDDTYYYKVTSKKNSDETYTYLYYIYLGKSAKPLGTTPEEEQGGKAHDAGIAMFARVSGSGENVVHSVFIACPNTPEQPVVCDTVSTFEYYFGEAPWVFENGLVYDTAIFPESYASKYMYGLNDLERSYIYAKELINLGMPVLYYSANTYKEAPTLELLYSKLIGHKYSGDKSAVPSILDDLLDRGEYDFKYLTTGAYPTFEVGGSDLITKCLTLCSNRGDAVALIDHTDDAERDLISTSANSVYKKVGDDTSINTLGTYGAMFTPWGTHSCATVGSSCYMPASFAYLKSLATAVKTNANWLAMAGVSRGTVPNLVGLHTEKKLTNAIADSYQSKTGKSINAITYIKPYGYTIWGNRTLKNNTGVLSATSFLNLRNLISDVKKVAYSAAVKLMFEHNSDLLWSRFRAELLPTLDQMVTGYGLQAYEIVRLSTPEHGKLRAQIKLYPAYAVEEFEVMITMLNEEVTVE